MIAFELGKPHLRLNISIDNALRGFLSCNSCNLIGASLYLGASHQSARSSEFTYDYS
jgi:hypothetical protein